MVKPPQPGRRPRSDAALERERRYTGWLAALSCPERDDEELDDSWTRFMAEERKAKEKARLQRVDLRRKEERRKVQAAVELEFQEALQRGEQGALNWQERRDETERRKAARGVSRINPDSMRQKKLRGELPPRKRGRPADPHREERRREALERELDWQIAEQTRAAPKRARAEGQWFQTCRMRAWLCGEGKLRADRDDRRLRSLGVPFAAIWWRRVAVRYRARAIWADLSGVRHHAPRVESAALAAARARAADAKALEAIALTEARADPSKQASAEAVSATAARAVSVAAAARFAEEVHSAYTSRGRAREDSEFFPLFEAALAREGVAVEEGGGRSMLTPPDLPPLPTPSTLCTRPRSTVGQCEGKTCFGERCKVHTSSPYAVAAPLRRGERFCGHHHPDKYTGVQCAAMKRHGRGQCRVWSGSFYADADPLRRGSLYCHHHRVQCEGRTWTGARCKVTSSSEHAHAEPLRKGGLLCAHHQVRDASHATGGRESAIASESESASDSESESDGFAYALEEEFSRGWGDGSDESGDEDLEQIASELGPGQWIDNQGHVREPWEESWDS